VKWRTIRWRPFCFTAEFVDNKIPLYAERGRASVSLQRCNQEWLGEKDKPNISVCLNLPLSSWFWKNSYLNNIWYFYLFLASFYFHWIQSKGVCTYVAHCHDLYDCMYALIGNCNDICVQSVIGKITLYCPMLGFHSMGMLLYNSDQRTSWRHFSSLDVRTCSTAEKVVCIYQKNFVYAGVLQIFHRKNRFDNTGLSKHVGYFGIRINWTKPENKNKRIRSKRSQHHAAV
jgi:hypothetical protein